MVDGAIFVPNAYQPNGQISLAPYYIHPCGFVYKNGFQMGDFWDAWWQQTYQVKSIVLGHVRTLRTTKTMETYPVSLLPPSVLYLPLQIVTFFSNTVSQGFLSAGDSVPHMRN